MSTVSDPFIVLEGGLVANEPGLPIYDLDLLWVDVVDDLAISEVVRLRDQASAHRSRLAQDLKRGYFDAQIAVLSRIVDRCDAWIAANAGS